MSAAETFENGVETQGKSKASNTSGRKKKKKVVLEKTEVGFCLNEDELLSNVCIRSSFILWVIFAL